MRIRQSVWLKIRGFTRYYKRTWQPGTGFRTLVKEDLIFEVQKDESRWH